MSNTEALQAARDLLADMPIPDGYYSASNEVISKLDAALAQPAASGEPARTGWLQDRGLLYRLTDDKRPQNRDEIRVAMADGSRTDEACARRAGELLDRINATAPQPVPALLPTMIDDFIVSLALQAVASPDASVPKLLRTLGYVPAASGEPVAPDMVLIPRWLVEAASASLGSFVSDHGWAQQDMDNMDSLDAYLASQPAAPGAPDAQSGRDWSLLEATQQSLREHMAEIQRLRAAVAAERERCAVLVEDTQRQWPGEGLDGWLLAAEIRAAA